METSKIYLEADGPEKRMNGVGGRKILRCVKTERRQTLAEITNEVNNVTPSSVSSRTVE